MNVQFVVNHVIQLTCCFHVAMPLFVKIALCVCPKMRRKGVRIVEKLFKAHVEYLVPLEENNQN